MFVFGIPVACPADAVGCDDTADPGFGLFSGDVVMAGGLLVVAIVAVIVAVVLIRRRS